jgi:hypothetical protein
MRNVYKIMFLSKANSGFKTANFFVRRIVKSNFKLNWCFGKGGCITYSWWYRWNCNLL